jgi:hypothetical protein
MADFGRLNGVFRHGPHDERGVGLTVDQTGDHRAAVTRDHVQLEVRADDGVGVDDVLEEIIQSRCATAPDRSGPSPAGLPFIA